MIGKTAIALAALVFCLAAEASAATLTWTITISPSGGGTVEWKTSSPSASGTLTASGSITFDVNAMIDLTFKPSTGNTLTYLDKNGTPWLSMLDSNNHYQFGPATSTHTITAVFSGGGGGTGSAPTGTFSFAFPQGTTSLSPVFDVTGRYTGVSPSANKRDYNIDLTMDEFGKLSAMGTVKGLASADGGSQISAQVGAVKTVDGQPTAMLKGKFAGTRDGAETQFSGGAEGLVQPRAITGGATGLSGTSTYKGKVGGVPFGDSNVAVQFPMDTTQVSNITKAWTIQINIASQMVKGKEQLTATGLLTLPNGERISFPAKKTKYSATKGYSLSFKKGTNLTRGAADKGSSVTIKSMTMSKSSTGTWTVTGGLIYYKFLGQSGSGDLVNFLP
jgi:hypothetical protein